MKRAHRELQQREADLRATRTVGWMLLVPGLLLLLPGALVLVDLASSNAMARNANRPVECSLVLGAPLVFAGARRLRNPERYRGHQGDRHDVE